MPIRFDAKMLYEALNKQRTGRGLTRADVARETGVSASTLTGTKRGGRLAVDGVLAMTNWLGRSVESFAHTTKV